MPKFDRQGLPLGALGNKYAQIAGAGTVTLVSSIANVCLARLVWVAGSGIVVAYDNNAGVASGNQLWNAAAPAGGIALLDLPASNGISVSVPVGTTVNVIYSE